MCVCVYMYVRVCACVCTLMKDQSMHKNYGTFWDDWQIRRSYNLIKTFAEPAAIGTNINAVVHHGTNTQ